MHRKDSSIQRPPMQYAAATSYTSVKLPLGVTLAHALAPRATALNMPKNSIHIVRATPFLVREHIHAKILLPLLHNLNVRRHAIGLELLGELIADGCGAVET